MKVNIIKGPLFTEREKQAQEMLYNIIKNDIKKNNNQKSA